MAPEPQAHGKFAKWEIKELPRAPRGLPRPCPQEGVGGMKCRGQGASKGSSCPPRMPCLVCCSVPLKLNPSPKTFNTPPDFRKPEDFSLE